MHVYPPQQAALSPMAAAVNKVDTCHHDNLNKLCFLRKSAKMDYTLIHAHVYVVQGDDYIYTNSF